MGTTLQSKQWLWRSASESSRKHCCPMPLAAGLAQAGDRHFRLRQFLFGSDGLSDIHAVGLQILLQLFRPGKMHRLPAGCLGAFDIHKRIVDEEAGGGV